MTQVELYWKRLALLTGDAREWYDLQPHEQGMIVQSLNLTIQVLNNGVNWKKEETNAA